MKKILVIDDEEMILDLMKVILEDLGFQVTGFNKSNYRLSHRPPGRERPKGRSNRSGEEAL